LLRLLRVIAVGTVAATLSSCWEGTTRGVLATVLFVEGPAVISLHLRTQLIPLTPGAHAGKGGIIETPNSSRAALALLPNLLVQLDRNARLEIMRLAITKDGNETGSSMQGRYADVKLMNGRMFASHDWGEAIAKFRVITPQGELFTTSSALFCVESDEKKTRVTCVSGSVEMRPRGGQAVTRIPPGFVGEWSASGSNLIAAESDTRGQEDLQEGLEVEEKLRGLISQNRYVLPK
jgi:FecR-like protein